MLPLLEHVADGGEYTIAGARDILADRYNMTEEERSQRLPSGAANTFYNRLAWAKTYLERAGLLINGWATGNSEICRCSTRKTCKEGRVSYNE